MRAHLQRCPRPWPGTQRPWCAAPHPSAPATPPPPEAHAAGHSPAHYVKALALLRSSQRHCEVHSLVLSQARLRALVDGYVAQDGCAGANEHIVMHFRVAVPCLLARAWPQHACAAITLVQRTDTREARSKAASVKHNLAGHTVSSRTSQRDILHDGNIVANNGCFTCTRPPTHVAKEHKSRLCRTVTPDCLLTYHIALYAKTSRPHLYIGVRQVQSCRASPRHAHLTDSAWHTPITTPVAWSSRRPLPSTAAGWMSTANTSLSQPHNMSLKQRIGTS